GRRPGRRRPDTERTRTYAGTRPTPWSRPSPACTSSSIRPRRILRRDDPALAVGPAHRAPAGSEAGQRHVLLGPDLLDAQAHRPTDLLRSQPDEGAQDEHLTSAPWEAVEPRRDHLRAV